jgi:hypothetical protein
VILDENTRRVPSFAFFNAREWRQRRLARVRQLRRLAALI